MMILIFTEYAELPPAEPADYPNLPAGTVPEEKLRSIYAHHLWQDRFLSLKAYETACKLLREKMNIPEPHFAFSQTGKPYITNGDAFVSISHSQGMAVCAVSDREVGIDIEKIRRLDRDTIMGISRHILAGSELSAILSLQDDELANEFFRIWTAKEAAVKFSGDGMAAASEYIIAAENDGSFSVTSPKGKMNIRSFVSQGYYVSLCC